MAAKTESQQTRNNFHMKLQHARYLVWMMLLPLEDHGFVCFGMLLFFPPARDECHVIMCHFLSKSDNVWKSIMRHRDGFFCHSFVWDSFDSPVKCAVVQTSTKVTSAAIRFCFWSYSVQTNLTAAFLQSLAILCDGRTVLSSMPHETSRPLHETNSFSTPLESSFAACNFLVNAAIWQKCAVHAQYKMLNFGQDELSSFLHYSETRLLLFVYVRNFVHKSWQILKKELFRSLKMFIPGSVSGRLL